MNMATYPKQALEPARFADVVGARAQRCLLAAYLAWSKLTSNDVVCPVGGCSSILSSQYAQIGPVPLPILGTLGYGSVAGLSVVGSQQVSKQSATAPGQGLKWTQRGILAGALHAVNRLGHSIRQRLQRSAVLFACVTTCLQALQLALCSPCI